MGNGILTVDVHEPLGKQESKAKRLSMDSVKLTIGKDTEERTGDPPFVFTLKADSKGLLQFRKAGYFPYQFHLQVDSLFTVTFDKPEGIDGPRMGGQLSHITVKDAFVMNVLNFEIARPVEFILVAGHDYEGSHAPDGKNIFRSAAFTRMCDRYGIGRSTLHPSTIFTVFDFTEGRRGQWVRGWDKQEGAQTGWPFWTSGWCKMSDELCGTTKPAFGPNLIKYPDSPDGLFLKEPDTSSISITNVYEYLQAVGKERPKTIKELSFFSHSWEYGPSLMNTDDPDENLGAERDPGDHDTRALKDFPNALATFLEGDNRDHADAAEKWPQSVMDKVNSLAATHKDEEARFRDSFAADAHLHVWGCTAHRRFRGLLRHAAKPGKDDGKSLGTWTYEEKHVKGSPFHPPLVPTGAGEDPDAREVVLAYFPPYGRLFPNTGIGARRAYLEWAYRFNYMYMLSCATGLPVWGAPPGLGSDIKDADGGKWGWMFVPQKNLETKTKICGSGKKKLTIDHSKEGYYYPGEFKMLKDKDRFPQGFEFDEDGYMKYVGP
jgi:hypothetical protein